MKLPAIQRACSCATTSSSTLAPARRVLHITFGFINDWAEPDRTNAHCYAQFTALANDFNSPADRRCH